MKKTLVLTAATLAVVLFCDASPASQLVPALWTSVEIKTMDGYKIEAATAGKELTRLAVTSGPCRAVLPKQLLPRHAYASLESIKLMDDRDEQGDFQLVSMELIFLSEDSSQHSGRIDWKLRKCEFIDREIFKDGDRIAE